jgi:hypothetical protein
VRFGFKTVEHAQVFRGIVTVICVDLVEPAIVTLAGTEQCKNRYSGQRQVHLSHRLFLP